MTLEYPSKVHARRGGQHLYIFALLGKKLIGHVSLEDQEHKDYAILMLVALYLHNYQCNMIHSTFSIHAGIWTKGLQMAVTQLYVESYGLDAPGLANLC